MIFDNIKQEVDSKSMKLRFEIRQIPIIRPFRCTKTLSLDNNLDDSSFDDFKGPSSRIMV